MYPFIDKSKCSNCGVCVVICPYEVFGIKLDNKVDVVLPENCIECGECIRNCDTNAIKLIRG